MESNRLITITKTEYKKCPRCWRHCQEVGNETDSWLDGKWPDLCDRCCSVLEQFYENGELEKMDKDLFDLRKKKGLEIGEVWKSTVNGKGYWCLPQNG